jgi:carbamate kinase
MRRRNINKPVVTLITQALVDKSDTAFQNPLKPIGPFYSEDEAKKISAEKGYVMREDAGRGWRRVVPSPMPIGILEINPIRALLKSSCVVIAGGGGGIPVVEKNGEIQGVAAVIDKDFASEKLAEELDADILLILTEVENVCINFNKPGHKRLELCTASEMEVYASEGHFAPGSMLPKVKASIRFASSKSQRSAIISSLELARQALDGIAGTRIVHG